MPSMLAATGLPVQPRCMMHTAQELFVHLPIALGVMLAGWALGLAMRIATAPAIWLGWFAAACTCVMREITQQEYRWIEAYGHGHRAEMPLLEGLRVWDWNAHSQIETLGALAGSALVALAIARRGRSGS